MNPGRRSRNFPRLKSFFGQIIKIQRRIEGERTRTRPCGIEIKEIGPLAHRNSRAISKHPSGNVHRGQLLEQKLGGVGDMDLGDAVLVVTQATFKETLFEFTIDCVSMRMHKK